MIDFDEAHRRAAQELSSYSSPGEGDGFVIVDAETIARPWGWVFFHTSKLYLETGDTRYAVAGNAPLLVERETGRVIALGTARQAVDYINNYERTGDPNRFDYGLLRAQSGLG
ncbi:YrhB domain-containing protein [Hydrogenophaga sp. XSHU_21]